MKMDNAFFDVITETKKLSLGSNNIANLYAVLTKFERVLLKFTERTHSLFVDTYYEQIRNCVFQMRESIPQHSKLRSFHDKIFTKILKIGKVVPLGITLLFEQFLKGITYFANQESNVTPIYHRLDACGPGNEAFRKTYLQCTQSMPKEKRRNVQRRIETCYKERLIYNKMWLHEKHAQNTEHIYQIEMVAKSDFHSCFPNVDIEVDVVFDGHMPVELTVMRNVRGKMVSKETYVKKIRRGAKSDYIPIVECMRTTSEFVYVKTQGYNCSRKWQKCTVKN